MTSAVETLTQQRRRGWMVMPHAVERFCERVAPQVPLDAAARWLTEHAHEAIDTGQRTFRGDRLYRLAHPWDGPDAVLVVKVDPDHTRAVVTCGWWDETATEEDTLATRDELPEARRGLQPRAVHPDAGHVTTLPEIPRPPRDLPCPPGTLDLSAILPGRTLDTNALSRPDLERWTDYVRTVKIRLANMGQGTAAALVKQIEVALRQCAHERLIHEQKAAAMRVRHHLPAAPPVDLATVDDAAARPLLMALCAVLRDVYGDSAHDVLVAEAGRRVGLRNGVDR